jgi:PAS domain S-box-containing protein
MTPNYNSLSKALWPDVESFADFLLDIFFIIDRQGRLLHANQRGLDKFGYLREKILGQHISNFVVPEERQSVFNRFNRLIKGKPVSPQAYKMLRSDGTTFTYLIRAKAINRNGQVYCICGFGVDLFKQEFDVRRAVRALCAKKAHLHGIIDALPHGVHELSTDGIIESCNPAFLKKTGYTEKALIGKPVFQLIPDPSDQKELEANLRNIFNNYPTLSPWKGAIQNKRGERIEIKIDWAYRKDQDGEINGAIGCISDITNTLKIRQKLAHSHKQLEQEVVQRTHELSKANATLLEKQTELIEQQRKLERSNRDLSDSNQAITHLAKSLDRAKKTSDQEIALALSKKVLPIVETLCNDTSFQKYKSELETLKVYINELTQPLEKSELFITLLSASEMRIASMIKNGLSSSKIALKLYVSKDTVKVHRRNIRKKLGLTNAKINLENYLRLKME